MTNLYEDGDYENALKQKNRMKLIYFIVLGIGLAACATVYVLFLQLPYQSTDAIRGQKNLYLFLEGVFSFLIAAFSFVFLGIPFKRYPHGTETEKREHLFIERRRYRNGKKRGFSGDDRAGVVG